jgi:hypothetical protein
MKRVFAELIVQALEYCERARRRQFLATIRIGLPAELKSAAKPHSVPPELCNPNKELGQPNPLDVLCPICKQVPINPVTLRCRQTVYCKECITEWRDKPPTLERQDLSEGSRLINTRFNCLVCKQQSAAILQLPGIAHTLIERVECRCPNACGLQVYPLYSLGEHLSTCTRPTYRCPAADCDFDCAREEMQAHVNGCRYVRLACPRCRFFVPRKMYAGHYCEPPLEWPDMEREGCPRGAKPWILEPPLILLNEEYDSITTYLIYSLMHNRTRLYSSPDIETYQKKRRRNKFLKKRSL